VVELERVDHVELQLLVDDLLLDLVRHLLPHLFRFKRRGQQEGAAGLDVREHVILLEEGEVVARHEVRLGAEVGAADELRAEAQMRNRDRAGFLRVVHEVALREVVGVFADDFDRVLVRADRAVRA